MAGHGALRAAIIGCGRMGGTIDDEVREREGILLPYGHAPAYLAAEGVDLVAAADVDAARLQAFADRFGIAQRFADHRAMLEAVRPDIVSITVRATDRVRIVLDAVAAGVRAIYAEKALACSLAEADAIVSACQGRVAFNIGTSRRYDPGYRQARALVAAGAIGEVRLAVAHAPGALLHTHSHTIDTLLFLLGDPEVQEVAGRFEGSPQLRDGALATDAAVAWAQIHAAGGRRAAILAAPGRYEFEVIGTAGAIRATNNGDVADWRLRLPAGPDHWREQPFPEHDRSVSATLCAVTELVEAVRSGRPTSGGVEVAAAGMEVAMAIAASALDAGRAVAVPLAARDLYIPSR